MSYTLGQWERQGAGVIVEQQGGKWVASIPQAFLPEEQPEREMAIANLIAAAPDLLGVVQRLHDMEFAIFTDEWEDLCHAAGDALQKAKGEQP